MSKIKWDPVGERFYEVGVDHGVLYPQVNGEYPKGVPWNGLTNVTENYSGAEDNRQYADNIPYLNLKSAEEYGLTIECFYYPDEWSVCNGETIISDGVIFGQQRRRNFGFSFRSKLGNDTDGEDYGFKLHLVYNCSASPSERSHETINESPDAGTFSFDVSTIPIDVRGKGPDGKPFKPVSCITIDSTKCDPDKLARLEAILYGSDEAGVDEEGSTGTTARLPLPEELKEIFAEG